MKLFNKKNIFLTIAILTIVSTISLPIRKTPWFEIAHPVAWQIDPDRLFSVIHAAENDWGFVRGSAQWARGNSTFIDQLLANMRDNGLLRLGDNQVYRDVDFGNGKKVNIKIDLSANFSVASGAFSGNKTFANRFEIWIPGDTSNTPALQLFFNSVDTLDENGALLYYNLPKLETTNSLNFGDANSVIETFIFRRANGTRRQVYTWKAIPVTSKNITDVGRVVLDEVLNNEQLCFRTAVRVPRTNLISLANNSFFTVSNINAVCGAGDNLYYTLAYMQKFQSPFLTTAKYGWTGNNERREGFCAFSGTNNNYGLFNDVGFERDKVATADVPASYPSPNQGTPNVDSAFERTYSDAGTLDQSEITSKAFIDGVPSNAAISFKASTPP
ncbi:LIC_12337 family protein [Leptospira sp. GIMC2001]|uniref:LIC_12337 family protein n=1 Tax=Leptospira sp. GIMC2001 TaxID=1513297 RepID=UPI00234AF507|nr:hypothetical protein [Leptospira sp. GIMC2001]WCL49348.1 hypothetical protein O4O04_18975 [Leptospira sp. GIMC2001]